MSGRAERRTVVITGLGLEVPGLASAEELLADGARLAKGEFKPQEKLGRKGLLNKDQATKLALCAAQAAFRDAGLEPARTAAGEPDGTGVVVSSNLGNLDTVCRLVDTIHAEGAVSCSVLDVPNASSNVIPAAIAIRLGLGGANLMVCSGATSGLEALRLGQDLIRAGRCPRVMVVGVEPDHEVGARLLAESLGGSTPEQRAGVLGFAGAAALVLEDEAAARQRKAPLRARLGTFARAAELAGAVAQALAGARSPAPLLWLTSNLAFPPAAAATAQVRAALERRARLCDVNRRCGDAYGALGVLQAVVACGALAGRTEPGGSALLTNGPAWGDGCAALTLEAADA